MLGLGLHNDLAPAAASDVALGGVERQAAERAGCPRHVRRGTRPQLVALAARPRLAVLAEPLLRVLATLAKGVYRLHIATQPSQPALAVGVVVARVESPAHG